MYSKEVQAAIDAREATTLLYQIAGAHSFWIKLDDTGQPYLAIQSNKKTSDDLFEISHECTGDLRDFLNKHLPKD